jgi:hypothetical protein
MLGGRLANQSPIVHHLGLNQTMPEPLKVVADF